MLKKLRLFFNRKKAKQLADYFTNNFKLFQTNYARFSESTYSNLILFKHQINLLNHLITFDKFAIIRSRQIGESLITSLYLIYKAAMHRFQNIVIVVPNEADVFQIKRKIIPIIASNPAIKYNVHELGIDFENDSTITIITAKNFTDTIDNIKQLNNLTLYLNHIERSKDIITIIDLNYFIAEENQLIVSSSGGLTPLMKILWDNKKKFARLLITQYKINFKRIK